MPSSLIEIKQFLEYLSKKYEGHLDFILLSNEVECVLAGFDTIAYFRENNEVEEILMAEQSIRNGLNDVKEQFLHKIRMGQLTNSDPDFMKLLSLI